jgi:hypothetical protein
MKTHLPFHAPSQKARRSVADIVEWCVLLGLLGATLFFFLNNNGFIDSSGIWPYPY